MHHHAHGPYDGGLYVITKLLRKYYNIVTKLLRKYEQIMNNRYKGHLRETSTILTFINIIRRFRQVTSSKAHIRLIFSPPPSENNLSQLVDFRKRLWYNIRVDSNTKVHTVYFLIAKEAPDAGSLFSLYSYFKWARNKDYSAFSLFCLVLNAFENETRLKIIVGD